MRLFTTYFAFSLLSFEQLGKDHRGDLWCSPEGEEGGEALVVLALSEKVFQKSHALSAEEEKRVREGKCAEVS